MGVREAFSEERLKAREHEVREQMQVLEAWKVTAATNFKRDAIGLLVDTLKLELMDIDAMRTFGPPLSATNADDPGYWEEKGRELKAEGEGLSKSWHDDENMGDA